MSQSCQSVSAAPASAGEPSTGDAPEGPVPDEPAKPEPVGPTRCAVTLNIQTPDCDPPLAGWIDLHFQHIAGLAGVTDGRLCLAVVGDEQMCQLHEQYRSEAGTTDVLTFDLRQSPDQPIEADIVICLNEAARQARQRGHQTRLETLLYAVHGLMHLLGEDDHDEAAFQQMHRREDALLTQAGFGPVFGLDTGGDGGRDRQ